MFNSNIVRINKTVHLVSLLISPSLFLKERKKTPPRPGLFWYEPTHRWRKTPEAGGSFSEKDLHDHVESSLSSIGKSVMRIADNIGNGIQDSHTLGMLEDLYFDIVDIQDGEGDYRETLRLFRNVAEEDSGYKKQLKSLRDEFWLLHDLVYEGEERDAYADIVDISIRDETARQAVIGLVGSLGDAVADFWYSIEDDMSINDDVREEIESIYEAGMQMSANALSSTTLDMLRSMRESYDLHEDQFWSEESEEFNTSLSMLTDVLEGIQQNSYFNLSLGKYGVSASNMETIDSVLSKMSVKEEPSYFNVNDNMFVREYTDDGYIELNDALRNRRDDMSADERFLIDSIQKNMKPIESKQILYRGMDTMLLNDANNPISVGETLNIRGVYEYVAQPHDSQTVRV